jgi:4-aminobutyrate aminotransferase-like enzyme
LCRLSSPDEVSHHTKKPYPRLALQAFAGIVTVSVGHCHPTVVEAMRVQNEKLQHTTTIYLNDQTALYAKELAARLPGDLKVRKTVRANLYKR